MHLELITIPSIAGGIFIAIGVLLFYVYFGYPMVAFLLSSLFGRPVRRAEITPRVSVIIAAHNEERDLAAKLENTLALDYPPEKLEVIVASDCSTDRTDEIARSYASRGVRLHAQAERHGKTVAQHRAVVASTGEILIFSDATTMYGPRAIRQIVHSFADPEVGCVAGDLRYVDPQATNIGDGCRSYWSYEKWIKRAESRLCSLIGVSGCFYAVRRCSHARIASDMIDDFAIATEIHLLGLRTVYDPQAICIEQTNKRSADEFRMRVRVIEQTMRALYRYREVLNPLRHGFYAWQMLSHKVLRYAVPWLLAVAFLTSTLAQGEAAILRVAFLAQLAFYALALAGWLGERAGLRVGPLAIPFYFVLVNLASLVAFVKFARGEAHVVWEPLRDSHPAGVEAIPAALNRS